MTPGFDLNLVKEVTDFMKANDLVELDLRMGKNEIRLKRGRHDAPVPAAPTHLAPQLAVAPAAATTSAEPVKAKKNYHVITSPFVGTFYRSPGPNQDSFVEIGKAVSPGETLCIIEAMKLMNEIESEFKGRVVSILAENGSPVEFGEALFEVEAQ